MNNANKGLLIKRSALGPIVVSAMVAAVLIAAASAPKRASALTRAQAAPTVKPSIVDTAAVECHGTIASTTDATDLPKGQVDMGIGFLHGTPAATFPARNKTKAVDGLFALTINAACQGLGATTSRIPCVQGGQFAGTIGSTGNMMLSFSDATGAFAQGADVLDGCQASFQVIPYGKNTSAFFISTGPITGGSSCKAAGTSLVVGCNSHNE